MRHWKASASGSLNKKKILKNFTPLTRYRDS
jgi:hypothetical protein